MSLTTLNINACAHNVCVCAKQTVLRADGSCLLQSDMQALQAAYPDAEMLSEAEHQLCMMEIPDTNHLPAGYQMMELRQFTLADIMIVRTFVIGMFPIRIKRTLPIKTIERPCIV